MWSERTARLIAVMLATVLAFWSTRAAAGEATGPKCRAEAVKVACPLILFNGRGDYNVSSSVAAEWFERVNAPSKTLVWFERSAHQMMNKEPGKMLVSLVKHARSIAERAGDVAPQPGENMSALPSKPLESGHAPVNGIDMYYEAHGRRDGVPLVLLHGGGSTIEVTFSRVIPVFANSRRVIAVEEQGHGRTSDRNQPVRFESSADDVASLLRHLKIEKADLFGFSNGASVALQVAIRHPHLVRKLIFASSVTKKDGAHPQLWEFMDKADFSNMPQPLKDAFLRVNPDMQKLKTMHDKDAERMRSFRDVPDDAVRSVRAPTLIVLGDQDIVKLEHAVELTRLISGARLLILPGGHGDYLGEAVMTQKETRYPELTARLIEEFLESR